MKKGANTARGRRREKRRGAGKAPHTAGKLENIASRIQGRTFLTDTSAASYVVKGLVPNLFGDRALSMADMYALWRPISIKVTTVPAATTDPTIFCLAMQYGDVSITTPTAIEEMVDFPLFAMGCGRYGSPFPSVKAGKAFFDQTPLDWYLTQNSGDAQFGYPGNLIIGQPFGTNSVIAHPYLIEWELEFRSMLDPSVSMQRLLDHAREREEEKKEDFPPLVEGDDVIVVCQVPPGKTSYSATLQRSPQSLPAVVKRK